MPANAQEKEAGVAGAENGLGDIVVTARRQEEKLQDVPVSISALDGKLLDQLNVVELSQIAKFTPNVSLTQLPGGLTGLAPFIRGIGNQDPLTTIDTPVGVYLDGVYLGRQASSNIELAEVERIEVLRGPQGTLFGRNTTGGAVSIVTRDPTNALGFEAKLSYASFDEWSSRTRVDTGELGGTGLRATLVYQHRERDGYVDNPLARDSHDPGALVSDAIWAKVVGEWGRLRLTYSYDYTDLEGMEPAFQPAVQSSDSAAYFGTSPFFGGSTLRVSLDRLGSITYVDPDIQQKSRSSGHSLTGEFELGDATALKSITAWRKWNAYQPLHTSPPGLLGFLLDPVSFAPAGVGPVSLFGGASTLDQDQFSQEIQILGHGDRFKYVAGLYYFEENVAEETPNFYTVALPGGQAGLNLTATQAYDGTSKSYAAFGQASFTPAMLGDRLELTAGLRYTEDRKSVDQHNPSTPTSAPLNRAARDTFDNLAFNVSASFKAQEDLLFYARIGSGYRSGGFNARASAAQSNFTFEPEKALSFEAGIKSDWFDRRLRINAAAFYTRYRDLQVAQYTGTNGVTDNANARYPGFEVEILAAPVEGLRLEGSIGYVDPSYTKFPYADPADPTGATVGDFKDVAKFPYVPKWTTHTGASYAFAPFAFGQLNVRADYSTQSKRYFHPLNLPNANPLSDLIADPGQRWLSARVALADIPLGNARAELALWGENLTDRNNVASGIDFGALGFAGRVFGMPRRFGVDLKIAY
ncbi:TonB-dependent receptor [Sphingomonas sp. DBB INV C78]